MSQLILLEDAVADDRSLRAEWSAPGTARDGAGNGQPLIPELERREFVDAARLGMLIFLGTETMLFAGFIAAFLVFRLGAPVWPPPFQPRLPVEMTGASTAVLLLSGYTMSRALSSLRGGNQAGLIRSLAQTAALGVTFLGVQGYEWTRLLWFGVTAPSGVYGGTFYTLIGAHAVHLVGALGWLSVNLIGAARGRFTRARRAGIPLCAMYWYFVVALWPILYALVYLA